MATKARLHWFWRGAIAVIVGLGMVFVVGEGPLPRYNAILWQAFHVRLLSESPGQLVEIVLGALPVLLVAVIAYGLLTHWLGKYASDGELHCRRCHHILRGLSEPRCPECGEAI
jgi:hypothetical protein